MPTAGTPTLAGIISSVQTNISAVVSASAPVFNHVVWGVRGSDLAKLRDSNSVLHTYMISARSAPEFEDEARRRFFSIHEIVILGYYAVIESTSPPSEVTFRNEIETIRTRLRFNKNIFGVPERIEKAQRAVQKRDFAAVEYMGVLCWFCELSLGVESIAVETGDGAP